MKKIIITAIISAFTTVIVSSSAKKQYTAALTADGNRIGFTNFRKDIGSAD